MHYKLKEVLSDIFSDMGFNLLGEEIDDFETDLNAAGYSIIDEVEYPNKLTELIADKLLNAIEEKRANFGSDKLNRIVNIAIGNEK